MPDICTRNISTIQLFLDVILELESEDQEEEYRIFGMEYPLLDGYKDDGILDTPLRLPKYQHHTRIDAHVFDYRTNAGEFSDTQLHLFQ